MCELCYIYQEERPSALMDHGLYDESLKQHQTDLMSPIIKLATSAQVVIVSERTAETYKM